MRCDVGVADDRGLFGRLGVPIDPGRPARGLSIADQQIVEIAKALSTDARVVVIDEPTAALSGVEVDPVYGPVDEASVPGFERIGYPGEFPFTRGLHSTGYRGRAWTIRQFAGFGNARQTNERYKMILAEGGGGLSVAFDMPTLMGRDSDDPRALGEVGHCGVAIDSAADMDILFSDIPLDETTTSMTISGPAVITEFDSTTVVLEGYEAEVDRFFNILIRKAES